MSAIKHTDLFDFPAYEAAIKEVQAETKKFGTDMEGILKRLKADQKELTSELSKYADILRNFSVAAANAGNSLKKMSTEIAEIKQRKEQAAQTEGAFTTIMANQKTTVASLKEEYKKLQQELQKLDVNSATYAEEQKKILDRVKQTVPAIQAYNQALRQARDTARTGEGTIREMRQRLAELKQKFIDLPGAVNPVTGALNRNNLAAVALQKEINQLDQAVKRTDAQMGIFSRNVGNYAGAINKSIGSFAGSFVAALGVGSAFQGAQQIFEVNRQFDQLNEALKNVTNSQAEYITSQEFLRRVTKQYGLDIVGLTEAYNKFFASSTAAGINAIQTRDIFDQVSKVAANLKLSQDDVNGVFRAFSQIAGKGKVQAEELRGQLGERIPGAASIAAKALGVTEQQLSKLLEQGQVYANDFLPKFAAELERTFGKQDTINSLTAEVNRFFNALKENIQSERATSFLSSAIALATRLVETLGQAGDALFNLSQDLSNQNYSLGDILTAKPLRDILGGTDISKQRKEADEEVAITREKFKKIELARQDFAKQNRDFQKEILKANLATITDLSKQYNASLQILPNPDNPQSKALMRQIKEQAAIYEALLADFNIKPTSSTTSTSTGKKGKSAAQIARENADEELRILREKLDQQILQEELFYEQGLQTEKEFQEEKLRLIDEYVKKAIDIEKNLGAGASESKIIDLQNQNAKALLEYQKFMNKKRELEEKDRVEQEKRDMDYMDRLMDEDATAILNLNKSNFKLRSSGFEEALALENQFFEAQTRGRQATQKEIREHLQRVVGIYRRFGKDVNEVYSELQKAERDRLITDETIQLVTNGLNAIADAEKARSDARFEQRRAELEKQKDAELAAAGNNAAAREQIEKRYQEKQKQEKIKQAKADKRNALFRIAISTAEGIAQTIARFGMPAAAPFIPFVIANGVIQAAVVAAQPIPAFRKGTKHAPKGLAVVGEEGSELVQSRDGGMFLTPSGPTLVKLQGGEKIYTARETTKIIEQAERQAAASMNINPDKSALSEALAVNRMKEVRQIEIIKESMKSNDKVLGKIFERAIQSIPHSTYSFDERGFRKRDSRLNQRSVSLNRRLS